MRHKPLVSIVIPLYNRLVFIEETLQSLVRQTYKHWEAIVVDDGSTDGSYERVAECVRREPRIKLYRRDREPKGASVCRNVGAERATGNYLIFLDSDDLLAPFCLAQRVNAFRTYADSDFIVFAILLFKKHPYDLNIYYNIDKENHDDLLRFIHFDAVWQTTGPIYSKSFFLSTGGFNESLPYMQDYEFHLRVLTHRPRYRRMMHLPPDCFLRKHSGPSISQGDVHTAEKIKIKEYVYLNTLDILRKDPTFDHYAAFDPMVLKVAWEWVHYHHDLPNAQRLWRHYYQNSSLQSWRYRAGCYYLKLLYVFRRPSLAYRLFSKAIQVLLPYPLTRPSTTLGRVHRPNVKQMRPEVILP